MNRFISKYRYVDIFILVIFTIGTALYHLFYDYLIKNITFLANIDSLYEKVRICLTSTSILLGALGLFISMMSKKRRPKYLTIAVLRSFVWLIIALFSGIITVAIVPVHQPVSSSLGVKHASFWVWTYLTGPIMYISLMLGIVWFLFVIRCYLYGNENQNK